MTYKTVPGTISKSEIVLTNSTPILTLDEKLRLVAYVNILIEMGTYIDKNATYETLGDRIN
jgi:hypothetical protein